LKEQWMSETHPQIISKYPHKKKLFIENPIEPVPHER